MQEKKVKRGLMKAKLAEIEASTYHRWSQEICERLFELPYWKNCNTIGITISRDREVDTSYIIKKAWDEKKRVVIPRCIPSSKTMTFRTFTNSSELEVGYSGLMEPKISETLVVQPHEIDLLIVPGICFDRNGFRIGYGGGYYDRYLNHFDQITLSIAFDIQLLNKLPIEPFDKPVEWIITNEQVINCHGK